MAIFLNLLLILSFTVLHTIDRSFVNNFNIFSYISLSSFIIIYIINSRKSESYLFALLYTGVVIDWFHNNFLGLTPLLILIPYFLHQGIEKKFNRNDTLIIFNNVFLGVMLYQLFFRFDDFHIGKMLTFVIACIIEGLLLNLYHKRN